MFSILLFHEISMTWWMTLFYSITFNCSHVLKRFVSLKPCSIFFLRKEEWKCGSLSVVINDFIVNYKIVTNRKFPIYFNGQWGRTVCSLSLLWNTKTGTDQDQICSFNIVSSLRKLVWRWTLMFTHNLKQTGSILSRQLSVTRYLYVFCDTALKQCNNPMLPWHSSLTRCSLYTCVTHEG